MEGRARRSDGCSLIFLSLVSSTLSPTEATLSLKRRKQAEAGCQGLTRQGGIGWGLQLGNAAREASEWEGSKPGEWWCGSEDRSEEEESQMGWRLTSNRFK